MFNLKSALTIGGVLLLGVALSAAPGDSWGNRTTHLTFSVPVALPGVTLPPGSCVFELAVPATSLDVVRVLSKDRSRNYFTGFTFPVQRPAGMRPNQAVSLGEAKAGSPLPIKAWYPIGNTMGHEFIYR